MAKERTEKSKFISRYAKHCLTIRPADYESNDKGKYAQFEENELMTTDPEVISFLRQHQEYNINIFEEQINEVEVKDVKVKEAEVKDVKIKNVEVTGGEK